jgi:hypothetical protein
MRSPSLVLPNHLINKALKVLESGNGGQKLDAFPVVDVSVGEMAETT